jgi:uncharacterized repeat protein (TIGR02543 family)
MANTYTVTFDTQGGETPVPASKGVTYDAAYGELATTTRTCYTFTGWYTAPSGGVLVLDTTIVSTANNHTLYAQWLIDTTAPVITTCAADPGPLSLGADCTVALPDLTGDVVATDNCGGVTVTQVPTSGTLIGADTLVTLTATDGAGNIGTCAVTVSVDECIEVEGEVPAEGEGEPMAEGEGEAPVEGEGEAPAEGEGEFTLEYSGPNPVVADAGDSLEINVIPKNGSEPIAYQWYRIREDKSLEPLSGQTEASLIFETVLESDSGDYLCSAQDVEHRVAQSPVITLSILAGVTASGVAVLIILSFILAAGGMAQTHKHTHKQ